MGRPVERGRLPLAGKLREDLPGTRPAGTRDERAGADDAAPRALVFDSWFDPYVGAVVLVRIMDGTLRKGDRIRMMAQGAERDVQVIHVVDPHPREVGELVAGEVGILSLIHI